MELIKQLSEEVFEKIRKGTDEDKIKYFKVLIGDLPKKEYGIGNTLIDIENPKLYGIYSNTFHGTTSYYLVVKVLDCETAFVWSLYPIEVESHTCTIFYAKGNHYTCQCGFKVKIKGLVTDWNYCPHCGSQIISWEQAKDNEEF